MKDIEEFKYICPICSKIIIYKSENGFNKAINNKWCRICIEKDKNLKESYHKYCPKCNKIIRFKYKSDLTKSIKNNCSCKSCSVNGGKFRYNHKLNNLYNNSKNNINKLLEQTHINFYWLGFIIADGSFYKNTFELNINIKDKLHLKLFKNHINFGKIIDKKSTNSCRIIINDRHSIHEVMNKYNINYNKTYNPIKLYNIIEMYKLTILERKWKIIKEIWNPLEI